MSLRSIITNLTLVVGVGFALVAQPVIAQSSWERIFSLSAGMDLRDVAVLDDQFVAVGDLGAVVTSPDGVNWQDRDAGTHESLGPIENFAGGLLVSGAAGSLFQSPDGKKWHHRLVGTIPRTLVVTTSVAVARSVGGNPTCFRSSNGSDWQEVKLAFTPDKLLAHREQVLVRTDDGRWFTSADALNWSEIIISAPSGILTNISNPVSNGTVLITRSEVDPSAIYRSADSLAWTRITFDVDIQSVFSDGHTFVAQTGPNSRLVSVDGLNWQPLAADTPTPFVRPSVGLAGVKILKGSSPLRSIDGGSESPLFLNANLDERRTSRMQGIAYGNGRWVSADGFSSSDGETWEASTNTALFSQQPPFNSNSAISFAHDRFFLSGAPTIDGTKQLWSSVDGKTFTLASTFDTHVHREVIYANGVFLLHSKFHGSVLRSTDGVNWTDASATLPFGSSEPDPNQASNGHFVLRPLLSDGFRFLVYFPYSGLYSSTDGLSWSALESNLPDRAFELSLSHHAGKYVATSNSSIWISDDAVNWNPVSGSPLSSITHALHTGENLILTGGKKGPGYLGVCATLDSRGIWSHSVQVTKKHHRGLATNGTKTIAAFGTSLWVSDDLEGPQISAISNRSTTAFEHQQKDFGVTAPSTSTLSYQWARNTLNITGANYPTFDRPLTVDSQRNPNNFTLKIADATHLTAIPFEVSIHPANPPTRDTTTGIYSTVLSGPLGSEYVSLRPAYNGQFLNYQWFKNGSKIPSVENGFYLPINAFTVGDRYQVLASNEIGTDRSDVFQVTWPTLETPEIEATLLSGVLGVVDYLQVSNHQSARYQWRRNGIAIPGKTGSTLRFFETPALHPFQLSPSGFYDVIAYNSLESKQSQPYRFQRENDAPLPAMMPSFPPLELRPARLSNLSVRAATQPGSAALTLGFVLSGELIVDAAKSNPILIRSVGPGLETYGVTAPVQNPHLQLFDQGSKVVGENSGWDTSLNLAPIFESVGAFPLPEGSSDAALIHEITPTSEQSIFTTQTKLETGDSGQLLTEVYQLPDGNGASLSNLSARGASSADSPFTVGFVISGEQSLSLLLRAVGPGLEAFGVPDAASSSRLVLLDADGQVVAEAEANYPSIAAGNESSFGAFPLAPGSPNAGLLIHLSAGAYTVQAQSDDGGVVLLELYRQQEVGMIVIEIPIIHIPAPRGTGP